VITYQEELEKRGISILAWEVFGSYQGDYAAIVHQGNRFGFVVIGYGSCSGCDALEGLQPWDDEELTEQAQTELNELIDGVIKSIKWGSRDEVAAILEEGLKDWDQLGSWFEYEKGYDEVKNKLIEALKEVELGGSTRISSEMKGRAITGAMEDVLKEQLRRKAQSEGYIETQAPVVYWDEQARKVVYDNFDNATDYREEFCSADDPQAFFNVGVKMKGVKVCLE